jgi:hypothetical protein
LAVWKTLVSGLKGNRLLGYHTGARLSTLIYLKELITATRGRTIVDTAVLLPGLAPAQKGESVIGSLPVLSG